MKRILVPVDFSDCSRAAARVAVTVAARTNAEIFFLHILPAETTRHVLQNGPGSDMPEETRAKIGHIRSELSTLVRNAEQAGVKATPELVFARAQDWIQNYIKPYRVDLVVMGSRGEGRLKTGFIGSTTLQFIRHADVPVLVIKKDVEKFEIRKIVFASDFKIDLVRPFRLVAELISSWSASLDLLYVCTPYHFVSTKSTLSSMKRFMHQFKEIMHTDHVYNATTEESGIHEFAKDHAADLIVLSTEGRSGLTRMLRPSIAEGLVKREPAPLLVLNTKSIKK